MQVFIYRMQVAIGIGGVASRRISSGNQMFYQNKLANCLPKALIGVKGCNETHLCTTITTLMYLDLTIRNIWAVVCFSIEIVDFMLSRGQQVW